jgi:hypothetical protein
MLLSCPFPSSLPFSFSFLELQILLCHFWLLFAVCVSTGLTNPSNGSKKSIRVLCALDIVCIHVRKTSQVCFLVPVHECRWTQLYFLKNLACVIQILHCLASLPPLVTNQRNLSLFILLIYFCGTGAWTQGFTLATQVFLPLELESWELFAWVVFKPQSSWSLPPQ